MKEVVITIICLTYNHEKYVRQAIEGALMQQRSFPIEIVIGEDHSTDRTREICIEYAAKYPDIIKLLLPKKILEIVKISIQY